MRPLATTAPRLGRLPESITTAARGERHAQRSGFRFHLPAPRLGTAHITLCGQHPRERARCAALVTQGLQLGRCGWRD